MTIVAQTDTPHLTVDAARLLVNQLRLHGVDRVFCVPGESYLAVLDALVDAPEIGVVTCRHEGGASMMAEAWGKLTGRPGVAFVTRGPGATNASAGIHVAHQDSTPMILFVGDIERGATQRDTFQEIDFEMMFRPITKWVSQIADARRLPELIGRAFNTAMSGRRGPVVLALHEDMLLDRVEALPAGRCLPGDLAPHPTQIEEIRARISAARAPILIVGGGGWSTEAAEAVQRFAESWDLPVCASFRCQDFVDNESPAYVGNLGLGANPSLIAAVQASDLVVLIGGRLGEVSSNGFTLLRHPLPEQDLIHIHADPAELGRLYHARVAVVAEATPTTIALATLVAPIERPWSDRLLTLRQAYLNWTTPGTVPGPLQMGEVMLHLRKVLAPDAILTNGAGNFAIWPNRYHRYRRFTTMLAPRSGSMGYGVPAAIAAKIRHPEREVICFAGDGDFLMTGQELATALKENAPIITLLVNNGTYGTIRMHQERDYPGRVSGTDLVNPDFQLLARAYGAHAERVTMTADFAPALQRARASGRMALIELVLAAEVISPADTITSLRGRAPAGKRAS